MLKLKFIKCCGPPLTVDPVKIESVSSTVATKLKDGIPKCIILDSTLRHKIEIGRGEASDVLLTAPSISRKHATLLYRRGQWSLTNNQVSRGGLSLNGSALRPSSSMPINHGDRLCVGPKNPHYNSYLYDVQTASPTERLPVDEENRTIGLPSTSDEIQSNGKLTGVKKVCGNAQSSGDSLVVLSGSGTAGTTDHSRVEASGSRANQPVSKRGGSALRTASLTSPAKVRCVSPLSVPSSTAEVRFGSKLSSDTSSATAHEQVFFRSGSVPPSPLATPTIEAEKTLSFTATPSFTASPSFTATPSITTTPSVTASPSCDPTPGVTKPSVGSRIRSTVLDQSFTFAETNTSSAANALSYNMHISSSNNSKRQICNKHMKPLGATTSPGPKSSSIRTAHPVQTVVTGFNGGNDRDAVTTRRKRSSTNSLKAPSSTGTHRNIEKSCRDIEREEVIDLCGASPDVTRITPRPPVSDLDLSEVIDLTETSYVVPTSMAAVRRTPQLSPDVIEIAEDVEVLTERAREHDVPVPLSQFHEGFQFHRQTSTIPDQRRPEPGWNMPTDVQNGPTLPVSVLRAQSSIGQVSQDRQGANISSIYVTKLGTVPGQSNGGILKLMKAADGSWVITPSMSSSSTSCTLTTTSMPSTHTSGISFKSVGTQRQPRKQPPISSAVSGDTLRGILSGSDQPSGYGLINRGESPAPTAGPPTPLTKSSRNVGLNVTVPQNQEEGQQQRTVSQNLTRSRPTNWNATGPVVDATDSPSILTTYGANGSLKVTINHSQRMGPSHTSSSRCITSATANNSTRRQALLVTPSTSSILPSVSSAQTSSTANNSTRHPALPVTPSTSSMLRSRRQSLLITPPTSLVLPSVSSAHHEYKQASTTQLQPSTLYTGNVSRSSVVSLPQGVAFQTHGGVEFQSPVGTVVPNLVPSDVSAGSGRSSDVSSLHPPSSLTNCSVASISQSANSTNRIVTCTFQPSSAANHAIASVVQPACSTTQASGCIGQSLHELMEAELECGICNEIFIKPTTTSCSHTFCEYCLSKWRARSNKCPLCRASITTCIRTLVLDSYIEKCVSQLDDGKRAARTKALTDRESETTVSSIGSGSARGAAAGSSAVRGAVSAGADRDAVGPNAAVIVSLPLRRRRRRRGH